MGLANWFKKPKSTAKIDCSIMLVLHYKNKSVANELLTALHNWKDTFGDEEKREMLFDSSECTISKFIVYFSPYSLECFLRYYKNLIDQQVVVPHSDGQIFKPAPVNLDIVYNTFSKKTTKDKKGNEHQILDSQHTLKKFKADKNKGYFISDDFVGILFLLYRLLFYYNYTTSSLASQDDPEAEYKKDKQLARFIRQNYLIEHKLQPNQIPTIPDYRHFERQDENAVFIPALVSANASVQATKQQNKQSSNADENDNYFAKYKDSKADAHISMSPAEKSLKAQSDSISKANSAKVAKAEKAKSSSKSKPATNSSSADGHVPKHMRSQKAEPHKSFGSFTSNSSSSSSSIASSSVAPSSSAPKSSISTHVKPYQSSHAESQQSSVAPSASSSSSSHMPEPTNVPTPEQIRKANKGSTNRQNDSVVESHTGQPTGEQSNDSKPSSKKSNGDYTVTVDAKKLAQHHFPLTTKPSYITGAIQLLLDSDPNLFHHGFKFRHFNVNDKMPTPEPIQEAIQSGNVDNQKYVLESDNQYKKIANEIIDSRSNILDMGYTRMLTNLLYGAYSKINNKISTLLTQEMNDKELTKHAQKYYNIHFDMGKAKLQQDRKVEMNSVDKALYNEYMSKKLKANNKINVQYHDKLRDLGAKMNDIANDVFYRARRQRNDELDTQINAIKNNDIHNVHLNIKNAEIEYGRKFSQAGTLLFNFLYERFQAHHDKTIEMVSRLIKEQIKMNNAKANMRQARAEVVKSHGNRQIHAKWVHEQKKQQQYINTLRGKIVQSTNQISDMRQSSDKLRDKLNEIIISNHTLHGKLNNAKATLAQNREQITKGKADSNKLLKVQIKQREQQEKFAKERQSFNSKNNSMVAQFNKDSITASISASSSASARISANENSIVNNNNSYRAKIYALQDEVTSAAKAKGGSTAQLQSQLNSARQSFGNYQKSIATSVSAHNQIIARSNSTEIASMNNANQSYQDKMSSLATALNSATVANANTSGVSSQLDAMRKSFNNFKSSQAVASARNSAEAANAISSAEKQNADYSSRIQDLLTQLENTSDNDDETATSTARELSQVKANYSTYARSVSTATSLRDAKAKLQQAVQNSNYNSQIRSLRSEVAKARSHSNSSSNTNQQNSEQSELASIKNRLANIASQSSEYKSSTASANMMESQSIANSNKATSSTISSANTGSTYHAGQDALEQRQLMQQMNTKRRNDALENEIKRIRKGRHGRKRKHFWQH